MEQRWNLPAVEVNRAAAVLARELGLPLLTSRVLLRNGLTSSAEVQHFLRPKLSTISDPFLLPEMDLAVDRLDAALRHRERILIYCDYDVDGITAAAIVARVLLAYGAKVQCFVPNRFEEGYGLSLSAIERCFSAFQPQLVVTVDCGTNSIEGVAKLRSLGADVIILDHHEFVGQRPACCALVNPKVRGDFDYLCSAGIGFKVAHALLKRNPLADFDLRDMLDLTALATLTDLVPLVGENRTFVKYGLRQMERTRWPGLAALIQLACIRPPIQTSDVGFKLGPRINSAGRMGDARTALDLLLTNDPVEGIRLAKELDSCNRTRQNIEREVTKEAERWLQNYFDPENHNTIVAGDDDWHDGVLGIVASRLTRRYNRPTLLVGFNGGGQGKGSGRSIQGFSLVEALRKCSRYLEQWGGHELAVGLTLQKKNFSLFREEFERVTRLILQGSPPVSQINIDHEVSLEEVGEEFLIEQEQLEPFGIGNEQPIFLARRVRPGGEPRVVRERHVRLDFPAGKRRLPAIYFDAADYPLPPQPWDVAFRATRNEHYGKDGIQLQIVAIRQSQAV
ncbi:MAG: single-stranded-DNA-specific exonuclease RecJ [Chthoniobacterales bacterium]|nr:single-stranded-DNA-specific exonuclease RecJ [Chthoniobacterales bacterium]